jgi:hypothetical protein
MTKINRKVTTDRRDTVRERETREGIKRFKWR